MSQQIIRNARSYAAKLEQYYSDLQRRRAKSPSTDRELKMLYKILCNCLSLPTPQRESEFLSYILRNRNPRFVEESVVPKGARVGTAKRAALQPAGVQ